MSFGEYQEKRVLVTGHTGFKGAWLVSWLKALGADVSGYALDPESGGLFEILDPELSHDFRDDIRDPNALRSAVEEVQPDIVFHLAAQALVGESYADPVNTLTTNVVGTAMVLESIRALEHDCHCVVVTSDKCYLNREWEFAYRETDHLGGHDVYSASKAAAEIMTASWRSSFFEGKGRVVTARGGNVIGGGDFTEGRIVPDCVSALQSGEEIEIRNPSAVRPWQHVLDCLSGYLVLGESLLSDRLPRQDADAFNFGPASESQRTVETLVSEILSHWPGKWNDASKPDAVHEAHRLAVSIDRAANVLGWSPTWSFSESVEESVRWYRISAGGASKEELQKETFAQIERYQNAFAGKLR